MESARDGKTQFMYAIGQLSEHFDLFWDQEFKGYHGFNRTDDIKRISMDNICSQRFTKNELDHYYILMKGLCPIVKDEICFQLLSMVMMFDTTDLFENDPLFFLLDTNSGNDSSMSSGQARPEHSSHRQTNFHEVKLLQTYYINLLKRRCMVLNVPHLQKLCDPDGLKMIMLSFKLLAQYVPSLM